MTPLHTQARRLAEAGIKVFPCVEDAKTPACTNGFKDASDDLAQIDAWWGENPNYNIGVCPEDAGWCVIDIDPGGEVPWIEAIQKEGGHDPTYEVVTPRGGRHLYFKGSIPTSASKLGAHVDTRGVGGYVLVPPSVVGGKSYGVAHDRTIAECPSWIEARLAARASRFDGDDDATDSPSAMARARDYLAGLVKRGGIAVSGRGGNDYTYKVLTFVKSLGISRTVALRLVLETGWNDACDPPWSMEELTVIRDNAYKYSQDPAGTNDVGASAEETFGKSEAFRDALAANRQRASRFKLWSEEELDNEPEPTWIVKDLIPDDSIVLWIGPSQSFKSFLLLDVLLSVSCGETTFGAVTEPAPVLYGAIEDMRNIGKARRRAWKFARGKEDVKLDNFKVSTVPYIGMPGDFDDWLAQIKAWLGGRKLRLLAIDTAGKTLMGLNENESGTVRTFFAMCNRLREEFGCTVVAIHHSGKDSERGARGSSAWNADFDSVIETIRPDKGLLNVEVTVRKHKNAAEGQRWTFKGNTVAGSLVFSPSTREEHRAAEEHGDFYAPTKIGKALAEAKAHSRRDALTTTMLWQRLGGGLGDESGVRKLEKLAKTLLKAYCDNDAGVLWWWYDATPGGTA